jgi:GxxExxY protein
VKSYPNLNPVPGAAFFFAIFAPLRDIDFEMTENDLSRQIVDAAYRIHTTLGPGLLESVYALTLAWELEQRGLRVVRQSEVPVVYQGTRIEAGFRADLIVDDQVIVEVKSVETLAPVHKKQLLTYLRLANKRLGLLINFNVVLIKDGITRIVNGLQE